VGEESSAAIRKTIKGAFKVRFREFLYFVGVFKEEPGWQLNQKLEPGYSADLRST
jgi:hypothetical protein